LKAASGLTLRNEEGKDGLQFEFDIEETESQ